MYKINLEETKYCELIGRYGSPGQPPKWVLGCLGLILLSSLIPIVAIFALNTTDGFHVQHFIYLGIGLFFVSLKWLIMWPKLPEKIIFDPTFRQVYLLDSRHQSMENTPSMSYGEINSLKVQKKVERSNKRSVTRYYVVLTKSDTSHWSLLGPYRREKEAAHELHHLLRLSQWTVDQGTKLGQVNSARDESEQSFTSGWTLPPRVSVDRLFKIESLSQYALISWEVRQPKGRAVATKLALVAFVMISFGATDLTDCSWIVSSISMIIALLIGRGIRRFNPEQEIKIYRDHIALSSTAGFKGDHAKLSYDTLNGLALDLRKEGTKLRFVTTSDLMALQDVDDTLNQSDIRGVFNVLSVLMKATYINTTHMSAGDMLRLEEMIQEHVLTMSDHQLT